MCHGKTKLMGARELRKRSRVEEEEAEEGGGPGGEGGREGGLEGRGGGLVDDYSTL